MSIQQFGLRTAGIEYSIITEKEEILDKINEILEDKSIGILGITETIYKMIEQEILKIQEKNNLPLIIKIPNS